MQASIRTPGSIWAKLIEANNEKSKKPDGRGDAFMFFVGGRASGKSTLLNRFLYPTRAEVPKPSEGLEYTYARKPSNYDHERKDLAHIWEIGGSQEFAQEIAQGDQLFLTGKQVITATVIIVVDLSDPSSLLGNLLYWLDQIKRKLVSTYAKFEKKGLQVPEQLRQRAKNKLYGQNEDKDLVYHSGVSIIIAATKCEALEGLEPEQRKVIARTLRFIAHANGASLTFLSNLQVGAESNDVATDKALLDNFSKLVNHVVFTGMEKKPVLKMAPQMDHQSPLMVPAGTDKFRDIGRPRGAVDDNLAAGLQEWKDLHDKMFPPKDAQKRKAKVVIDDQYKDDEIDIIKERKLQELEAYRKDQEAAKEAARKRLLQAKEAKEAGKKDTSKKDTNPVRRSSNSGTGAAAGAAAAKPAAKKPAAKPAAAKPAAAKPALDGAAPAAAAAAAPANGTPPPAAKPKPKPKLPAAKPAAAAAPQPAA